MDLAFGDFEMKVELMTNIDMLNSTDYRGLFIQIKRCSYTQFEYLNLSSQALLKGNR